MRSLLELKKFSVEKIYIICEREASQNAALSEHAVLHFDIVQFI